MLYLAGGIEIADNEIEITAIRAQGAGGQNVNKVSSAIHLRFDIRASSLPDFHKQRLLALRDQRITSDGVIVIKAQQFRTREKNRADALERLRQLIEGATATRKVRRPTRTPKSSIKRRLDKKARQGERKQLRGKIKPDD